MPAAPKKSLSQVCAVLRRQAGALVAHRERKHAALPPSANLDLRAGWRIFDGVAQNLSERLLDKDRVDLNERYLARQIDLDRVRREWTEAALQRRIDDVGHLGPFELRL